MRRKRKQPIKEMSYVCSPSNFSIQVKYTYSTHKTNRPGIAVNVYDNKTIVFAKEFAANKALTNRFDYDDILKKFLEHMMGFRRDNFLKHFAKDEKLSLRFYDNVEIVRSKLGTVIFKRENISYRSQSQVSLKKQS
jgi:hypothetical protein